MKKDFIFHVFRSSPAYIPAPRELPLAPTLAASLWSHRSSGKLSRAGTPWLDSVKSVFQINLYCGFQNH